MKKNIFNLFFEKVFDVPFWIKQVMYLELAKEMQENFCENILRDDSIELFSTFVPTVTFKGKTELIQRSCGLDTNIYNFLESCANELSLLEIAVNTFHSMEEIAKYFELCIEQNFIKNPDSEEIRVMSGFISGKYRTGEYFKQKGVIDVDQLQKAILENQKLIEQGARKKFGEVLISLGYITQKDIKALMTLKEESKKRFILDYNKVPKSETPFVNDTQRFEDEISKLKDENNQLKQKLIQILNLVKKNNK